MEPLPYEEPEEPEEEEVEEEGIATGSIEEIEMNEAKEIFNTIDAPKEDDGEDDDDPMGDEDTTASRNLVKFLKRECGVSKDDADFAVMNVQANLRVNDASLALALEEFADRCDYEPADEDEYQELVCKISPVVSTTRTWDYRGHTQSELVKMGVIERNSKEDT